MNLFLGSVHEEESVQANPTVELREGKIYINHYLSQAYRCFVDLKQNQNDSKSIIFTLNGPWTKKYVFNGSLLKKIW
jgi:hypothetical protein